MQQFLPLLRYICPHLAMGNPFEVRHICSAFTESVCPFLGIRVRTMPPISSDKATVPSMELA
ncbi:hypothetical protein WT77_25050 [Burkholderia stagnalis]|nr:hypothetical protein WT77_25050 [Burkholderia stagnalis]